MGRGFGAGGTSAETGFATLARGGTLAFEALEHRADGGFERVRLACTGGEARGWQIARNGAAHLALGPGYVPLAVHSCGVCATDLARRFLPFPLPQVIGHEVLAVDAAGRRCVVEINASCRARGVPGCERCRAGLDHHCAERRVLGIHDLPGGFGPWLLAPKAAIHLVPVALTDETAVLVEPFAAALHAVERADWRAGDRVAVLGPRRLGMLVIAALAAERRRTGRDAEIVAVVRRAELAPLARELGADAVECLAGGRSLPADFADVVFDTTGAPEGLASALPAARRELHLKSTHGQPAGGLAHLTEAVVDELGFVRGDEASAPAGATVVRSAREADAAIRPDPDVEASAVGPCGTIHVHPDAADSDAPLLQHVARRGLTVRTSRCGDFAVALERLAGDPALAELGARFVSHRFAAEDLARAFEVAASPAAIKVLVEQR